MSAFCEHGNMRRSCAECRQDVIAQAEARAAANRERGDVRERGQVDVPTLMYPWQQEAYKAWEAQKRDGLVALSPGIPIGELPWAALAMHLNRSSSHGAIVVVEPQYVDMVSKRVEDQFGLKTVKMVDIHFEPPHDDGTVIVTDLEELRGAEPGIWNRFMQNAILLLLCADDVTPGFGEILQTCGFGARMCISRQPSAIDLLLSRPWSRGFGPLAYRFTEIQARDMGAIPRIGYKVQVQAILREEPEDPQEGPWDETEIPSRLGPSHIDDECVQRAQDWAASRVGDDAVIVAPEAVDGAAGHVAQPSTVRPDNLPSFERFVLGNPASGVMDLLRLSDSGYKARGRQSVMIEDVVVSPVAAHLCQLSPRDQGWTNAARQLDRATMGLLLAEDAKNAIDQDDLEVLVGMALALRGMRAGELQGLATAVERAAAVALGKETVDVDTMVHLGRATNGMGSALLVAADAGPADLLRVAHPGFTPTLPDLPHPYLYDASSHAWRGKSFLRLAKANSRGDLVTAWGEDEMLRFVFPSSLLLEVCTEYCKRNKLLHPLARAPLQSVPWTTRQATSGSRDAAIGTLRTWVEALATAEEDERKFLAKFHASQPERERRREGMALPDLIVFNQNRDVVTLGRHTGKFPKTNISVGAEVSLVEVGTTNTLARGHVSRLSNNRLTVEMTGGMPPKLSGRVTVNLTFDSKVFEAYGAAVRAAQRSMSSTKEEDDGPDGLLRTVLLGEEETRKSIQQEFPDDDLTDSQAEAVHKVLGGGRVHLIHGPPGTGKSHTLTRMAAALGRAGHSVLVTADSNAAVDHMVVSLRRTGNLVLRIGHAANLREEAAEACRVDPLEAPAVVRWAAQQGIIIATTNYGAFRYLDTKGGMDSICFDYVIHDEAGQSTAPSSLAALQRGRRLVLAGDPKQLPPTVVSMDAKQAGLDVPLFEKVQELTGMDRTTLLDTQFRMREKICQFSSDRYYEGRLKTAPSAAKQQRHPEWPEIAFQHVTGRENARRKSGSVSNTLEVDCVAAFIEMIRPELRERGWTAAVLTPYQAQRELLRQRLDDIEVSTVDAAQGREWDIVFYTTVRSNPRHRLGFLSDERRLNVAVTRAKRNLIVVGDERSLRTHDGFRQLMNMSEKVRRFYPDPSRMPRGTGSKLHKDPPQQQGSSGKGKGGGGKPKKPRGAPPN